MVNKIVLLLVKYRLSIVIGVVGLLAFLKLKDWFGVNNDFVEIETHNSSSLADYVVDSKVQELIAAINGFEVFLVGYGTYEAKIENVVAGLSGADWALIHNAFGKRPYLNTFGKVYSAGSHFLGFPPLRSLNEVLQYELSKTDPVYKDVKRLYSSVGIDFS